MPLMNDETQTNLKRPRSFTEDTTDSYSEYSVAQPTTKKQRQEDQLPEPSTTELPVTTACSSRCSENFGSEAVELSSSDKLYFIEIESTSDGEGSDADSSSNKDIRFELKDRVHRNYPLVDFVEYVLGFSAESIPMGETGYKIDYEKLNSYVRSEYRKIGDRGFTGNSANSCAIFESIVQDLVELLKTNWREEQKMDWETDFDGEFCHLEDWIVSGSYIDSYPDFGWLKKGSLEEDRDNLSWPELGLIGELKKSTAKEEPRTFLRDLSIDISIFRDVASNGCQTKDHVARKIKAEKSEDRRDEDETHGHLTPESVKSSDVEGIEENDKSTSLSSPLGRTKGGDKAPITSRPEESTVLQDSGENLTTFELQIVKLLREALSHGIRQYATGFVVEDNQISLWYADCHGVVQSQGFDFMLDPQYLLLIIAAMSFAERADFGFSPFVTGLRAREENIWRRARLEFSRASDIEGNAIEPYLVFPFQVTPSRKLLVDHGIVGRRTVIAPIVPGKGQATIKTLALDSNMALVAKMSWQYKCRREEETIKMIRRVLSDPKDSAHKAILKHVVDLKCSLSLAANDPDVSLPRAFMDALPNSDPELDLREFRIMILEAYQPLEAIDDADDFKQVFRDVVIAHRWIWLTAEILHRDISIGNIMFRRRGNTVEGVLCDWDMAETKADLGDPEDPCFVHPWEIEHLRRNNAQSHSEDEDADGHVASDDMPGSQRDGHHITGTVPFMALELLSCEHGSVPLHTYSFEIQSFFYLLCWVCATHNPQEKTMGCIEQWCLDNPRHVAYAKEAFLNFPQERTTVFKKAHTSYRPLIRSWVDNLVPMFARMWKLSASLTQLRAALAWAIYRKENDEKVGEIKGEIVRKARERDDVLTFDKFMAKIE
ncbi:hypothetical protein K474DRAFT_1709698 [Panus rudis PR-1116 ss-1]|nr:hypothetical protein K474DRAFT_1709698 [Panus rudis PR-1116 ss-1]